MFPELYLFKPRLKETKAITTQSTTNPIKPKTHQMLKEVRINCAGTNAKKKVGMSE